MSCAVLWLFIVERWCVSAKEYGGISCLNDEWKELKNSPITYCMSIPEL